MIIYSVWYDDYTEGDQLRAVFSTKEKAQKWIDREVEELTWDNEPMWDRSNFSIDSHIVDDEDE